jgi:hypothetical protein
MSKLSEVIVLHQVGMKPMSFRTKMTKNDFFDALNEQGTRATTRR